jgi:hypothetical protein
MITLQNHWLFFVKSSGILAGRSGALSTVQLSAFEKITCGGAVMGTNGQL